MTDAAESSLDQPVQRHFVFTTTEADALALEAMLKPADRGWRSLLGYALALPPLVLISWLTRNAEWPVWFASFGVVGLVCWQGARFFLKAERGRAARRHPIGQGQLTCANGRFEGVVNGVTIDVLTGRGTRIETDSGHLYIVDQAQPALILPLSAFNGRADMTAFAAVLGHAG